MDVIRTKAFFGMLAAPRWDDPSGCQKALFQDGLILPVDLLEFRHNIGSASIGFVHIPSLSYETGIREPLHTPKSR